MRNKSDLFAIVYNTGEGEYPPDYPLIDLYPVSKNYTDYHSQRIFNEITNRYSLKNLCFFSSFKKAEMQHDDRIQNAPGFLGNSFRRFSIVQFEVNDENQVTQITSLSNLRDVKYSEKDKKYIGVYSVFNLKSEQLSQNALMDVNRQYCNYRTQKPEAVIWLLQGIQLVRQGKFSFDIYLMIFGKLCGLDTLHTEKFYDQVCFKNTQNFIVGDLKSYAGEGAFNYLTGYFQHVIKWGYPSFELTIPHCSRAISLTQACENSKSLAEIKSLIGTQISFFRQKIKPDENIGLAHEQAFTEFQEDEFINIMERNYKRI